MKPFIFEDGAALVTGAASGIGWALAENLAARGAHLALVDRDAAGLEKIAALVRRRGVSASTHTFDLSQREGIAPLVADVMHEHGRVTLLINNAGVSLQGSFEEISLDEFAWLMNINFGAVVALTKACLPHLLAAGGAHLVNVSSLYGIIAPPGESAYAASKFAVRGFTEALRHELTGRVGVTVVHPGGVKTNIAFSTRRAAASNVDEASARQAAVRFTENVKTTPAEAAAATLQAVARRRGRVIIGRDARAVEAVQRLAPALYWRLLKGAFERSLGAEPKLEAGDASLKGPRLEDAS